MVEREAKSPEKWGRLHFGLQYPQSGFCNLEKAFSTYFLLIIFLKFHSQDNIVEGEVHVDPKHHKYFVAKRGEKLREIGEDFGGVVVSFPRNGVTSDRVVLKGAKDCIEGAKKRILEIVDELESMVSIECVVPQKYHRNIMGAKGVNVQKVTSEHNVQIKFPDRDAANRGQGMMNGNSSPVEENGGEPGSPPASPRKCDVITIVGSKDNAEAARQALLVRSV